MTGKNIKLEIGGNVRKRRLSLPYATGTPKRKSRVEHMTIEQLAKASNMSMGAVARIERGEVFPNLETLGALAQALYCSMSDLLEGI